MKNKKDDEKRSQKKRGNKKDDERNDSIKIEGKTWNILKWPSVWLWIIFSF